MNHEQSIRLTPKEKRGTVALLLGRYFAGYEDDLPHNRTVAFEIEKIYQGDQELLRTLQTLGYLSKDKLERK